MGDEKECIICLTDTSDNDYLELDCCKKTVHIECLHKWIKTNIKNTQQVKKCFHCKGDNDYINTIIYYTKLEERTNNANYDSDNNSLIEIPVNNNVNDTRQSKCCLIIFNILCFVTMITVITIFIITPNNNDY